MNAFKTVSVKITFFQVLSPRTVCPIVSDTQLIQILNMYWRTTPAGWLVESQFGARGNYGHSRCRLQAASHPRDREALPTLRGPG